MNKIAFLIGTNDVGGAEFVSYHHVLMTYNHGTEIIVLSGTGGKFYDLIRQNGIKIVIVGLNPKIETIHKLIKGYDIIFNCNFFDITPTIVRLKEILHFRYLTIIHNDTEIVYQQCRIFDHYTDGYYAIHRKIVDSFTRNGKMYRQKFTVIPNCVDNELILSNAGNRKSIRKCLGYSDDDFVIGMISRVAPDKNIIDAIKILSSLPKSLNSKLLILGGPVSENFPSTHYFLDVLNTIRTIKKGKVKNDVVITGNLSSVEVYKLLWAFDLGLNCSPSEGLPIALLEMMSAGIPCIMPGIGDIPNVLGGRGIVVPLRQRLKFVEIMSVPCYNRYEINDFVHNIIALGKNRNEMKKLGDASKSYIKKFRSLKHQKKRLLTFLDI